MKRWLVLAALVLALILVPFALFGGAIETWATTTVAALRDRPAVMGALIIALLASDAVLPVPASVVSTMSGALFGWRLGALLIWIGMTLGAVLAYELGSRSARALAPRWFDAGELDRARRLFTTVGPAALIVTRAVPVLSEGAALAAGAARMPFGLFVLTVAVANTVVALAYALVGAAAASAGSFLVAFTGLAVIPAVAWGAWRMSR